eukprot:GEMP01044154.1.p1 GENE.GEMP01044154.1~~GEMP01044154.1.p1  ORF type:complete len:575 (+),score=120.75 GEMP01044154.1:68-1726(+)
MNAWTTFCASTHVAQKNAQGPFKVSAYVDADLFAKKAVKMAIKARVPSLHFDKPELKQVKPSTPHATSNWFLDVKTSQRTVTSLYDRLGGFSGIQKFITHILEEASSEPVLAEAWCMEVLKSDQVERYLCYLLGSKLPADEHCTRALVLELKETLATDPDAPWVERAEALCQCVSTSLLRQNVSNDIMVEIEILTDCLKKKFLYPSEPQRRKFDCNLMVRGTKSLIIPADVLEVTADILHEAAEQLEDPLNKCFVNATINVAEVTQNDENSCMIYFSVIPQFFEYLEILKQHDVRSVGTFMDVVTSRIEFTYSEMVKKYEAEQRLKRQKLQEEENKELALELEAELDAEYALEVRAEVEQEEIAMQSGEAALGSQNPSEAGYQLYVPGDPFSAPSTVRLDSARDAPGYPDHPDHTGYKLYVEDPEHADHAYVEDTQHADHTGHPDHAGYKLYVEDPEHPVSVIDLEEHRLELEQRELMITSSFNAHRCRFARRGDVSRKPREVVPKTRCRCAGREAGHFFIRATGTHLVRGMRHGGRGGDLGTRSRYCKIDR